MLYEKKDLLNIVEKFLVKEQISPTTFGLLSINSPTFVFDLRKGRGCREETQEKILNFINNYHQKEQTGE